MLTTKEQEFIDQFMACLENCSRDHIPMYVGIYKDTWHHEFDTDMPEWLCNIANTIMKRATS